MGTQSNPSEPLWREIRPTGPENDDYDGVGQWIRHLFSSGEGTLADEGEMDARVAELVRDFLRDPAISSQAGLDALVGGFGDSRMPQAPRSLPEYLRYLEAQVIPHTMRVSSPRFIGHMTSVLPYFVRPLARLLTAMNQNMVKTETSKVLTFYERQALARLHRLIYRLPEPFYHHHGQRTESTLGIVTSGGTLANITALWCARNRRLGPDGHFRGVEATGFPAALAHYGYRGMVVIGSTQMHYSFDKAAELMGIGCDHLLRVPTDVAGRVDLRAMRAAADRCREQNLLVLALVGVAGSTDSGSADDLSALADLAGEIGAHVHVDAAWGGPMIFSDAYRHRLAGIERADSVTLDGHKQLYLPMGIGMVFLRDPHLARGIQRHAPYTLRSGSADLGQRSLEGSRPAMSLLLHATLELIGQRGYAFLVEEGIRKTRYFTGCVRSRPEFELLCEPQMNIVLYRYLPEEWRRETEARLLDPEAHGSIGAINRLLQETQCARGRTFVSRTTSRATMYGPDVPVVALRAILANPLTTHDDIDDVLDDQASMAAELCAGDAWRVA